VGRRKKTMKQNKEWIRVLKFVLFSASAGVIQIGSFTLLNECTEWRYWPCYLISLLLSIVWNFTFNRKFTFKSATNIPVAMLKIFGFYCVFTPISTIIGEIVMRNTSWEFAEYIVLACTMATNMVTEFLFCRFVVYKDSMNTNDLAKKKEEESVNATK
jgi:putative flippase GtrA